MLTLTSNEQARKLIKNGVLVVDDDIEIAFDGFEIYADIKCHNIYSKDCRRNISAYNISALNIFALNIDASNIDARNINARNINAYDINARNIDAYDINARNIDASNIDARNINARNIDASNITYYAVCFAYENITCTSIKGRRENAKHFVLDGKIKIKEKELSLKGKKVKVEIDGKEYTATLE